MHELLLRTLPHRASLCDTKAMTFCDTEHCEYCHADTVEGNDEQGRCVTCLGDTSLEHMLKLMSQGITRNSTTGQFERISKR